MRSWGSGAVRDSISTSPKLTVTPSVMSTSAPRQASPKARCGAVGVVAVEAVIPRIADGAVGGADEEAAGPHAVMVDEQDLHGDVFHREGLPVGHGRCRRDVPGRSGRSAPPDGGRGFQIPRSCTPGCGGPAYPARPCGRCACGKSGRNGAFLSRRKAPVPGRRPPGVHRCRRPAGSIPART